MNVQNVMRVVVVILLMGTIGLKSAWAVESNMNLDVAIKMINAAEEKAKAIGVPMVITVLDGGGNMIAQHRMDDALLVSVEVSLNKAYSAVAVKLPTDRIGELCQPGETLYGLQNCSRMVIFGGGIPIKVGDKVIGGIGVSGGSVEDDMQCAKSGMAAFAIK